jgi:DNA-binding MarR family transcriptional regulator
MTSPASATTVRDVSKSELLEPIREMSYAILRQAKAPMVAAGMVPATFWPLHHLGEGHLVHPSDLARHMGVTPATCTASIDQLVELGFVVRRPDASDRRQVVLAVTPKGQRALESVWRAIDVALRGALDGISAKDVATTARTLDLIATRLQATLLHPEAGA